MISVGRETLVPARNFVVLMAVFGAFQLIFLFQVYYTAMHQIPTQCDCQCTKQLHISTGMEENNREIQILSDGKLISGNEEKLLKSILNAEDNELDREWHKKQRNASIEEAPDEKTPYQPETDDSEEEEESPDQPAAVAAASVGKLLVPRKPALNLQAIINEVLTYRPLKLNPEISEKKSRCYGNHSDTIVIYVYSAPGHLSQRSRIRNTWGSVKQHKNLKFKVVFFIGALSPENSIYYSKIKNESRIFGDVVQDISYIDAYRNLTLKGVSALQWVSKFCPNSYRVMKVDDDTLLNPFHMVKFFSGQSEKTMSELICKVTQDVGPIRDPKSKYFVSAKEYSSSSYPNYCQGYGYIFPPKLIPEILNKLPERKLIAMEDVYFTGLIRELIGAQLHSLTAMFSTTYHKFETFLERITVRQELMVIGHVHDDKSAEIHWELIRQRNKSQQYREAQLAKKKKK